MRMCHIACHNKFMKKIPNFNRMDFSQLQASRNSTEMRELASRICRDYLTGAWKTISASDLNIKRIRYVFNSKQINFVPSHFDVEWFISPPSPKYAFHLASISQFIDWNNFYFTLKLFTLLLLLWPNTFSSF